MHTSPLRIGGSTAARMMGCAASLQATAGIEVEASPYMAEGTTAHLHAAHYASVDRLPGPGEIEDPGAESAVREWVELLRATRRPGDRLLVEQWIALPGFDPRLSIGGTADAIILSPARRHLALLDLKYGRGVGVEAAGNAQLRTYAYAALRGGLVDFPCETIELVILQPRHRHPAGPIRRETISAFELCRWGAGLMAAARRALDPDATRTPGDWCKFCPVKPTCGAYANRAGLIAREAFTAFTE